MTISLKHSFNLAKSDGTDTTIVKPSDWNAEHVITLGAGKVLGRDASGSGAVQELPISVDSSLQSMKPPSGTTAQRPATPAAGMMRYNSTTTRLEAYIDSAWTGVGRAVSVGTSAPSNNYSGDLYFNTSTGALQVHNGTSFVDANGVADGSVTLAKLAAAVQELLVPTATLMPYAGTTAPSGWLLCYGQAVSRTTYASLFAKLSTTFGAGDGSTTFNLPDLRGRAIAGKDNMGGTSANRLTNQSGGLDGDVLGATGGSETHTLVTSEMPAHSHLSGIGDTSTASFVYGGSSTGTPGSASQNVSTGTGTPTTQSVTSTTGGDGAHNNVQPTIVMNYIIKT